MLIIKKIKIKLKLFSLLLNIMKEKSMFKIKFLHPD